MIVVDANIAIAVLNASDPFHRTALERCVRAQGVSILNLTRAEALIHPTKSGVAEAAAATLDALGFVTHPISNDIADQARVLRAEYGSRNFPLIDAIVVAFGIIRGQTVVTADAKWPAISEATIEVLSIA